MIGHDLLYLTRTDRGPVYVVYTYIYVTCKMQIVHTDNRLFIAVTLANDRLALSSERAPHINKPATV
jgi:hypothetical protein